MCVCVYIYIYIYIYMCVCVCARSSDTVPVYLCVWFLCLMIYQPL